MHWPTAVSLRSVNETFEALFLSVGRMIAYRCNNHENIIILPLLNHPPFRSNFTKNKQNHGDQGDPCCHIDQRSAVLCVYLRHDEDAGESLDNSMEGIHIGDANRRLKLSLLI